MLLLLKLSTFGPRFRQLRSLGQSTLRCQTRGTFPSLGTDLHWHQRWAFVRRTPLLGRIPGNLDLHWLDFHWCHKIIALRFLRLVKLIQVLPGDLLLQLKPFLFLVRVNLWLSVSWHDLGRTKTSAHGVMLLGNVPFVICTVLYWMWARKSTNYSLRGMEGLILALSWLMASFDVGSLLGIVSLKWLHFTDLSLNFIAVQWCQVISNGGVSYSTV